MHQSAYTAETAFPRADLSRISLHGRRYRHLLRVTGTHQGRLISTAVAAWRFPVLVHTGADRLLDYGIAIRPRARRDIALMLILIVLPEHFRVQVWNLLEVKGFLLLCRLRGWVYH